MKLSDLFPRKAIVADLKAADKDAAFRELVEILRKAHKPEKVTAADILKVLKAREGLGSTGIGNGVAIPHAKVPGVKETIGAFGRAETGIDFKAVDASPVQIVCLIVSPPEAATQHQEALRVVSSAIRSGNVCKFLKAARTVREIEAIFSEVDEAAPV